MSSQVHSTPDVQISRFDKDASTSKTAFARSQLAKRFLVNRAQQRSVPIQSLSNTSNTHEFSTNSTDPQATTSLTATLAASVAISVAQPFLKLQNDLEQKMNSVLDQIQQQQQRANTGGFVVPVTAVPHPSAAADSSKLLTDCVDNRMKYMEKVQEQQQQVLKQLVDMVNTTKPTSQSPGRGYKSSNDVEGKCTSLSNIKSRLLTCFGCLASHALSPPLQQYHFLDSLVGSSSPPVRLTKSPKKHSTHKRTSTSPSAQKRPSRVTATRTRTTKTRSPVTFKQQPPNSRFNIEPASPFDCSVCDRSRSRSRSRSPTKGLSPDSSYPRPFAPIPRPASIMSDGFIPRSASPFAGNALTETYAPFDKYLNNFIPPSPLEPKPARVNDENVDLHERIKQIDEARHLLDENYLTLQRRKNDTALLQPTTNDSSRIQRLVEQCVKQVTRQVREEVKVKLEQEESQEQEKKTVVNVKKRPTSRTHLAFDRHSTTRAGKQSLPENEPSGPAKPYSDAFMEAVYGRSLYQKIKKDGKQPYFKLKGQPVQRPKQPKQIEQIPVRDTGLVSMMH